MLTAIGYFGHTSYTAIEKIFQYRSQMMLGKEIISNAEKALKIRHSSETFKIFQSYREQLNSEKRKQLFSEYIKAYDEKNKFIARKKLDRFKRGEINYRAHIDEEMGFLEQEFKYYGSITLSIFLATVFGFYIFAKRNLLNPIVNLNKKMIDFLNEKYTYQFIVPQNNEVGRLQSTFNSLAQQTLANIEKLKELDRAKSEFLSIASHELRTPLTSIKGSLGLLKQGIAGPLAEPVKKLVDIANEETDRLIRLINDILDLTKMEAKKLTLNQNWYSLDEVVNRTFNSLSGLSATAHISLHYKKEVPYLVNVDFDRIQQVLTNLLSNAIKFSPVNGQVTLSVNIQDNGKLRVCVNDQGNGIAPEDQELIFQQFRQATSDKKPLVKGTGLGLAIAKALVEEHKGEIGVESLVGKGSTFYFTLPKWKLDMSDSTIKMREEVA